MAGPELTFRLHGVFSVTASDGTDLTPTSRKACGLLALLVEAPGMQRSRVALQDKLWSDRAPEQSGASLRQELSKIRKAWGAWADILGADSRVVSLREDAVQLVQDNDAPLLEGIDVRDPEFEDWLRSRRASTPSTAMISNAAPAVPILLVQDPGENDGDVVADYVRHAIAMGIADWGGIDVRRMGDALPEDTTAPVLVLETRGQALGDGIALRAGLTSQRSGRVRWQVAEFVTPTDPDALARFVNGCIDRTLEALSSARPYCGQASAVGYFKDMQTMFQSQGRDYDQLYRTFEERFERDGRGINLALQAFLACWIMGERYSRDLAAIKENARELIRRAIELEPHNALVHAIGSHVFGFVLGETGIAHELALRSTRLDANGPLGWAFRAVANINIGETAQAYQDIVHARSISGAGPHLSMIDSLTVFSGVLSGKAAEVLPIGQTLCALKPTYVAPLRYMFVGYMELGDEARARMVLEQLKTAEPDFELSYLSEPEYPVEALRRSELIDVARITRLSRPML